MKKKKIVSVVAFMLCTAMLAGTITACTSQSADTTQNTTDDTTQGGVTQMETTYDTENSGGNISELIDTSKREYYPISVLENFRVQTAEITATATQTAKVTYNAEYVENGIKITAKVVDPETVIISLFICRRQILSCAATALR